MNEDIHERVFSFVVRGLQVPKHLPKSIESKIVIDQFLRSLTSIGANDTEADGASSRKDFIHVYSIVRKELKETHYWLRVIAELFPSVKPRLTELSKESEELIRIISSIIRNTIKNS